MEIFNSHLVAEIVVIFVLLMLYFTASNFGDGQDWLRALVLAVAIPLLNTLPDYIGWMGWAVSLVVTMILISKTTGQSMTGAILFLLVIEVVHYIVVIGIEKFL